MQQLLRVCSRWRHSFDYHSSRVTFALHDAGEFLCYVCHKERGWKADSLPVFVGAAPPDCGRSSSSSFGSGFRAAAAGHAHCCLCRRASMDGKQLLFLDRFGLCRSRAFPTVPDGCLSASLLTADETRTQRLLLSVVDTVSLYNRGIIYLPPSSGRVSGPHSAEPAVQLRPVPLCCLVPPPRLLLSRQAPT